MRLTNTLCLLLLISITSCFGQNSQQYKARNNVQFEYEVVLPEGYQKGKPYELAVVFSEIEAKNGGYAPTLAGLQKQTGLKNTIYFVPKVPLGRPHWISHPIHHGLNDFMRGMRDEYGKSGQKFHFIGHLLGGRVAQTYAGMSSEYVASLSFTQSTHWDITKQEYFDGTFNRGFEIYVYDNRDPKSLSIDVSKTHFTNSDNFGTALNQVDARVK